MRKMFTDSQPSVGLEEVHKSNDVKYINCEPKDKSPSDRVIWRGDEEINSLLSGTSDGSTLTLEQTSNLEEVPTLPRKYDGGDDETFKVYKPDQSLNKKDEVEFAGIKIDNKDVVTKDETEKVDDAPAFWKDGSLTSIPATGGQQTVVTQINPETGKLEYKWSQVSSGSSFVFANREEYNNAKLIPQGQSGAIPDGAIVVIQDEVNYLKGENR